MRISANDVVALLKKVDEVEEKAGRAFSSYDQEDMQAALESARELRPMLYAMLASAAEEGMPYPAHCPAAPCRDISWQDMTRVTCGAPGNG